jgi:hypothetical protein
VVKLNCPQGLKPLFKNQFYGTAEGVPLTERKDAFLVSPKVPLQESFYGTAEQVAGKRRRSLQKHVPRAKARA